MKDIKDFVINTLIAATGISLFGKEYELVGQIAIGVSVIILVRGTYYLFETLRK